MNNENFTTAIAVEQSPQQVFNAINNVSGWWSQEIEGPTENLNDVFNYHYQDVHRCKIKVLESVPNKKVVWQVLENYFSFTNNKQEWIDTTIHFDIEKNNNKTTLLFTHEGLTPEYECYDACKNGWSMYINKSLYNLITTGKGQPNGTEQAYTVHEVAARFSELAKQEHWFKIQDDLFAENVQSIEPANSPYLKNAAGKKAVRKKGEEWVKRIEAVHRSFTSETIVAGKNFAVAREVDITVKGLGRIQLNEIIRYEVEHGKIITEQFFY